MPQEDFAKALMSEADALIAALTCYSKPLAEFTHMREAEMKSGDKVLKVEIAKKQSEKAPRTHAKLGNTIWSNSIRELEKTLIDAGVNPKDVKIEMR